MKLRKEASRNDSNRSRSRFLSLLAIKRRCRRHYTFATNGR